MDIEAEMKNALIGKGAPQNQPHVKIDALLDERAKTHGEYTGHAEISQRLKAHWKNHNLTDVQHESLDMIAHKIGRILAGDPDFRDHWNDIAGYAKLAADRCTK